MPVWIPRSRRKPASAARRAVRVAAGGETGRGARPAPGGRGGGAPGGKGVGGEAVRGGGLLGGKNEREPLQPIGVALRQLSPPLIHGVQPAQDDAPDRGLDVVEPQVEPHLAVDVLVEPAVVAQAPAPRDRK